MGKEGAVISRQPLTDEFLDGFHACEEMLKIEHTAVCLEMDVDTIWQVLFCLTEHDVEEDGEQGWSQGAPCLTLLDMMKLPTVTCCGLPDLADLYDSPDVILCG